MTGTEPKRRRLWRGGRYSLPKIFLNFYLLAMTTFVAIALFAEILISSVVQGITDEYARRFMRGTILLIEEDLNRYPVSEWEKRLEVIDLGFAYRLSLQAREALPLPTALLEKIDAMEIASDQAGETMYFSLGDSGYVLVVGPLSARHNPELQPPGLPLEVRTRILTWSVFGLLFAIALWFWVRPIWRDLEGLRQTARALGDGDFTARSPGAQTKLFAPLTETMDSMAEEIQRLIATQKELSSSISHELRTPIARLRFASEMLACADSPEEKDHLSSMMESDLEELDNLVDSSLTYARFDREVFAMNLSPVKLGPWLSDEADRARILANALTLHLDLSPEEEQTTITLDKKIMHHAISNLLRNATKYAQTQIRISARLTPESAAICVDDDGIGIPVEDRERVFSAFTRLDRSRDRSTGGYGLGLAIARRVLELHAGAISIEDSPLGGARFIISWPQHPAEDE